MMACRNKRNPGWDYIFGTETGRANAITILLYKTVQRNTRAETVISILHYFQKKEFNIKPKNTNTTKAFSDSVKVNLQTYHSLRGELNVSVWE